MRSCEETWTRPAPDRVIYDVGRDHDPKRLIFDHHQKNPPLGEDGQPYSSFGLIWRHFGKDYLRAFGVPERDLDPHPRRLRGRFRPAHQLGGQRHAVAHRAAIEKSGAEHLPIVIHPRETDWALAGIRRKAEGFALRADLP